MLLTRYWTKFNIAGVCVSLVLFFICTRITHGPRLFQKSPVDYYFVGTPLHYPDRLLLLFSLLSFDVAASYGPFHSTYNKRLRKKGP